MLLWVSELLVYMSIMTIFSEGANYLCNVRALFSSLLLTDLWDINNTVGHFSGHGFSSTLVIVGGFEIFPLQCLRGCPSTVLRAVAQIRRHRRRARSRGLATAVWLRWHVAAGVRIITRTSGTCRRLSILVPSPIPSVIQLGCFIELDTTRTVQCTVPIASLRITISTYARSEVKSKMITPCKPVAADGATPIPIPSLMPSVVVSQPIKGLDGRLSGS